MNTSHAAASRSRSAESRTFSPERVSEDTQSASASPPSAPTHAWIPPLRRRLLNKQTKIGSSAKLVLTTLFEHVDPDGRTWVGVETIAEDANFGSTQTVRKALQKLEEAGWLRIVPQTWSSLTAEQTAVGRKPPRRGDVGQAPNLYIVLDGHGNPASGPTRPGLARISSPCSSPEDVVTEDPPQILEAGPCKKQNGGPLSNPIDDQDPSEDCSMKESGEGCAPDTHISSKIPSKGSGNLAAWDVLVAAHIERSKGSYPLPPLRPDVKREQREELAKALDDAATHVCAKLHTRIGVEQTFVEVRRDLAKRVMHLYFERDNEHLRRVKHALRDLPREFHARLTEAMNIVLRESIDATPPRRAQVAPAPEPVVHADKPREIEPKTQPEPTTSRVESSDKPVEVAQQKAPKRVVHAEVARCGRALLEAMNAAMTETKKLEEPSKPALPVRKLVKPEEATVSEDKPTLMLSKKFEPQRCWDKPNEEPTHEPSKGLDSRDKPFNDVASMNTTRDVEQVVEGPKASPQQELVGASSDETCAHAPSITAKRSEETTAEREQIDTSSEKVDQDKLEPMPSRMFEQQRSEDKPESTSQEPLRHERPLGRSGAPRWGAMGPRPTKGSLTQKQKRRVRKLVPNEAGSEEEHGGGSTSPK